MNRFLSLLASVAALVTGLANPDSIVPARVQPFLVGAGALLLGIERVIVYLESKPNPVDAVTEALDHILGKLPKTTVAPTPPATPVVQAAPPVVPPAT